MNEQEKSDGVLNELVEPLRAHLVLLDEEVEQVTRSREALLAQRAKVRKTLAYLVPEPKKAKVKRGTNENGRNVSEETVAEVLKFLESHREEYAAGFVAAPLAKEINLAGNPVGKDTVRKAVLVLHDRGVIRADRKTIGGGTLYKVVGNG